uniref:Uncharacterized protein n=1 Tax=Oxyrrhis marina TaxID=2969 RepID=A0A7S3ULT7_OXYMA
MISYAFVAVPPFPIITPEVAQSVSEGFEKASAKVQERVDDFKKTPTGQKISAAATSASDYMSAAFDSFLDRTEALVDSMLPPLEEPADVAHSEEESAATTTTPSCSTKDQAADEKKPATDAQQHQGELARALGLAGTVCSRVYTRADKYVIEPCKEYTSGLWEFWHFLWTGTKEFCCDAWTTFKAWFSRKYTEMKQKAPELWHSIKVGAVGCWEWLKSVACFTFTKAKEYSLMLKTKVIEVYNKILTPERKHAIQEVYKTISVKAYELFNLAKDAVVKAAKFVYAKLSSIFTWQNFENGWTAIGSAFTCPWACGASAATKA